jgi:hypothetical protein
VTSQVVIMNKLAAAVASDSSVTMSDGDRPLRSYPTAEKMFPLEVPHRLVILHNGSTDLLRVPYAVLLEEWAASLTEACRTVCDYAVSFTAWLEQQTGLFDDANQTWFLDWLLRDYLLAVREDILDACRDRSLDPEQWATETGAGLLHDVLTSRLEHLSDRPRFAHPDEAHVRQFLATNATTVEGVIEWVFDDTPRSPEGDVLIHQLVETVLGVAEPFSSDAGLVFVGFGTEELFPASQCLDVAGMIAGRVRATLREYQKVTTDDNVYIPYAQTEAMHTFLSGYHPDVLQAAHENLDEVLASLHPGDGTPAADPAARHDELTKRVEDLSWKEFINPMLATVAGLPSAELARTADALVRLQVLRKLTRAEPETVGGPVDVGLVTRRTGFAWLRHKTLLNELAVEP